MRIFSKVITYVKTNGDTLNFRSEPNGSILSTLDNGSIIKMLVKPVNAGKHDWIPVSSNGVEGWVAAEFITEANVVYRIDRIIDPSARGSDSVGTTAFKVELADKTLRFIELSIPPGIKIEEFSSLSDKELVQRAIDLYDVNWERYKDRPMS